MLDWVSIDKAKNTIRVTATIEIFRAYQQQTMYVGIRVLTNSVPAVINSQTFFTVTFESLELVECSQSEIIGPLSIPDGIQIAVFDEDPFEFTLDDVTDSGTLNLQKVPGFEKTSCGPFVIQLKKGV